MCETAAFNTAKKNRVLLLLLLTAPLSCKNHEKRYIPTEVNTLNVKMPIINILAFFCFRIYFLALS